MLRRQVTGMPFHEALSRTIFQPLQMENAYLLQHSGPLQENTRPMAGVYAADTNLAHYRSLSVDYAGGGVTAPLEDLLKFMQAVVQGRLLQAETLETMMNDCAKFSLGIVLLRDNEDPWLSPADAKASCMLGQRRGHRRIHVLPSRPGRLPYRKP